MHNSTFNVNRCCLLIELISKRKVVITIPIILQLCTILQNPLEGYMGRHFRKAE